MGRGWWYKHCDKWLPLKCHCFRERSNFPRIWFRDLRFRTWGLEIDHVNAHNFLWQGCFFLSLLSRNFDDRLSSNFHRFVILCICWDTSNVKASLWQLPIVSTVFNISVINIQCLSKVPPLRIPDSWDCLHDPKMILKNKQF